jgi:hypothetical protein
MPDLLDCLMPGCHEVSAVTTPMPAIEAVTFKLAVTQAARREFRA